ncbi:MAG TPA: hypothetical protein VEX86_01030 [Longimicrobium sp.]|nr:hypothetical protein [Longimicrobium sp.]
MRLTLRACAAAAAALSLAGCTSWQPHAALTPSTEFRGDARVTRTDDAVLVVRSPAIAGDTLTGGLAAAQRVAIPLSDIRAVHTRRRDMGRTILALGVAALLGLYIHSEGSHTVVD